MDKFIDIDEFEVKNHNGKLKVIDFGLIADPDLTPEAKILYLIIDDVYTTGVHITTDEVIKRMGRNKEGECYTAEDLVGPLQEIYNIDDEFFKNNSANIFYKWIGVDINE